MHLQQDFAHGYSFMGIPQEYMYGSCIVFLLYKDGIQENFSPTPPPLSPQLSISR
jgi:hypothetical protein